MVWHFVGIGALIIGAAAFKTLQRHKFVEGFLNFQHPLQHQMKMKLEEKVLRGFGPSMTEFEAKKILNMTDDIPLSADAIKKAHRKLMVLNHPDSGGSTYIASKINEAKDFLIKLIDNNAK